MNSFYKPFLDHSFVLSYPCSIFMELNMTLVRFSGATTLRDCKCAHLLAQWMSPLPLILARFLEAMEHTALPRSTKAKCRPSVHMRRPCFLHPI